MNTTDLTVVVGASSDKGTMRLYRDQLAAAGIDTRVEWRTDWSAATDTLGRQLDYIREISRGYPHEHRLIFSDAWDVTFYGTAAQVMAKIPREGVMIAAERNCYPDATIARHIVGTTPWRYANGGLLAGLASEFLMWIDDLQSHPAYHPALCNQGFYNLLRLLRWPLLRLDSRTDLFYCLYGEERELQWDDDGLPRNSLCATRPNFIHANGHWPAAHLLRDQQRSLVKMTVDDVRLCGQGMLSPVQPLDMPPLPTGWQPATPDAPQTPPTVAVCIPFGFRNSDGTLRWVPPEFTMALTLLQVPPGVSVAYFATKGVKRDEARNDLCEQARQAGAKFILMLDDDNPPPPDALTKLLYVMELSDPDVAVCGGIYVSKQSPPSPLVFQSEQSGPYWRWRIGEVFPCSAVATGSMMVRVAALDHIPQPWFKDITSLDEAHAHGWYLDCLPGATVLIGDDMFFCRKVREAGYRILAHGGVLPAHWSQDGREYRIPEDSYPYGREVERSAAAADD